MSAPEIKPATMLGGYVECALWLSDEEIGRDVSAHDLPEETLTKLAEDVTTFHALCPALIQAARELGQSDAQIGHDLFLTRNGHGAGFWDRGLGDIGEALSEAARRVGPRDLYRGDDGKVYAA